MSRLSQRSWTTIFFTLLLSICLTFLFYLLQLLIPPDKQKIENETKKQSERDSTIDVLEEQLKRWTTKVSNKFIIVLLPIQFIRAIFFISPFVQTCRDIQWNHKFSFSFSLFYSLCAPHGRIRCKKRKKTSMATSKRYMKCLLALGSCSGTVGIHWRKKIIPRLNRDFLLIRRFLESTPFEKKKWEKWKIWRNSHPYSEKKNPTENKSKICFLNISSLLNNDQGAVLDLMCSEHGITIHNVRLYLGIVKRRTDSIIHRLNYSDQPSKILAKRDRIPKFNIDDTSVAPAEEWKKKYS